MADPADAMPAADELNLFLVVFELTGHANGNGPRDVHLREALQAHPATAQLTDTAWVVRTPRSVTGVFDALDRHLGPHDRLFVGSLTGEAAWRNLDAGYAWLAEAFEPGGLVDERQS